MVVRGGGHLGHGDGYVCGVGLGLAVCAGATAIPTAMNKSKQSTSRNGFVAMAIISMKSADTSQG